MGLLGELAAARRPLEALASRYRLAMPERQRSARVGELLGRRAGSSVEFQDRKQYTAGDDLRHVDWRAYARTERLTVKLYREEICPRVDIIVDTSASMFTTDLKIGRAAELAVMFERMAAGLHATVRLHRMGERLDPLGHAMDLQACEPRPLADPLPLVQSSSVVRRGGIKIVLSDFLFPFSPRLWAGAFAAADRLVCVQVLSAFEDHPPAGGALRLMEAETGHTRDVALDGPTVRGYLERLTRLREDLERQLRLRGGALAIVRDEDTLDQTAQTLLRAGVIEV